MSLFRMEPREVDERPISVEYDGASISDTLPITSISRVSLNLLAEELDIENVEGMGKEELYDLVFPGVRV